MHWFLGQWQWWLIICIDYFTWPIHFVPSSSFQNKAFTLLAGSDKHGDSFVQLQAQGLLIFVHGTLHTSCYGRNVRSVARLTSDYEVKLIQLSLKYVTILFILNYYFKINIILLSFKDYFCKDPKPVLRYFTHPQGPIVCAENWLMGIMTIYLLIKKEEKCTDVKFVVSSGIEPGMTRTTQAR